MNQPIRQAQGEKGFSQVILLGMIATFILAGVGGFLALQEKKIPFFEKIVQQDVSSEDATSPIALGDLCAGREECISFCLNNRGRCEKYCNGNKNELCRIIFPPEKTNREKVSLPQTKTAQQPSETSSAQSPQPVPVTNCVSNPNPVFTAPFTDETKILSFSQIGSNAFYNPGSQARSYVAVKAGELVPVYAPTDSTVTRIVYSYKNYPNLKRPEYRIDLRVSCEVTYAFDHIFTISDTLQAQAPQTPAEGRSDGAYVKIPVQAGELIGYTSGTVQAGTWDFLFLNEAQRAPHFNLLRWTSEHSKYADCPYDYFVPELKEKYYSLLPKTHDGKADCGPFVRDVPGTIAGYWFQGNASESYGSRFGIASNAHFVEFVRALEDGSFFFIRDTSPSRVTLESVTLGASACYYDNGKNNHAYLKLLSETQLGLATGNGTCPSIFPATYEVWER